MSRCPTSFFINNAWVLSGFEFSRFNCWSVIDLRSLLTQEQLGLLSALVSQSEPADSLGGEISDLMLDER